MLEALYAPLLEESGMYQDETVEFLHEEFRALVTLPSVERAPKKMMGWTKKTTRRLAPECLVVLRDFFFHGLTEFSTCHLILIDDSGCDKRVSPRRTGWSPRGVATV